MAKRWIFAGGGIEDIAPVAGTPSLVDTNASRRDTLYSDHSVSSAAGAGSAFRYPFPQDTQIAGEEVFLRFTAWNNSVGTAATNVFEILNYSLNPWLAVRVTATGFLNLSVNTSATATPNWVRIGSNDLVFGQTVMRIFVIRVKRGSPDVIGWSVFSYGTSSWEVVEENINLTPSPVPASEFGSLLVRTVQSNHNIMTSEVALAVDINLVGSNVSYLKPTGAGANSGFSGSFAEIDDVGTNDVDFVSATSSGLRSTFVYSNIPTLPIQQSVGDVFSMLRAANDGSAPINLKPVRRTSGGVDDVGANIVGVGGTFTTLRTRYSGLTFSEVNASEFGFESAP